MYREKLPSWLKHLDFTLIDLISLCAAFTIACTVRFGVRMYDNYRHMITVLMLIQFIVSVYAQPFKGILRRDAYKELAKSFQHVLLISLIAGEYLFFSKGAELFSRLVMGLTALLYFLMTFLLRQFWKWVLSKLTFSYGRRSLFLVTDRGSVDDVLARISRETALSYHVTAIALTDGDGTWTKHENIPILSDKGEALQFLRSHWVDEVLISVTSGSASDESFLRELGRMGITVHTVLVGNSQAFGKTQKVENFGDYTVLTSSVNLVTPGQMIAKRLMDILGGILGCIITGVLTVFWTPVILIMSPGPVFFAQTRVGKNGKQFKMYKFRSMCTDAEAKKQQLQCDNLVKDGRMFVVEHDPRIIGSKLLPDGTYKKGIGNFLRNTSLDEFPQFFNVLRGDMSLVGTRPPTVDEWNKYEMHHRARLATKPGITGLWQVSGRNKITDFEEVVKLDTEYIRRWNLGLDLKILFKTLGVVFSRDGSM